MAVVQAQVQVDDQDPSTPVLLFTASADCVVNVFCVNPDDAPQEAFIEVRLQDAAQSGEQLLVPGTLVGPTGRMGEGPVYRAARGNVDGCGRHAAPVLDRRRGTVFSGWSLLVLR